MVAQVQFAQKENGKSEKNLNSFSFIQDFQIIEEAYHQIEDNLLNIKNQAKDLNEQQLIRNDVVEKSSIASKNSKKRKRQKKKVDDDLEFLNTLQKTTERERQKEIKELGNYSIHALGSGVKSKSLQE